MAIREVLARRQRGWLTDYLWEKEPETKGGHSVTKASHRIPKTATLSQRESYISLSHTYARGKAIL